MIKANHLKYLLFLLLSANFLCNLATAQSRSFDCSGNYLSNLEGAKLQQITQSTYATVQSIKTKFIQESYLSSLDISETSEGEMTFERPGKIRWDYSVPEPQTFLLNNETVYLYQPADKQLVIDEMKEVLLSELPVSFIMGIGSLQKDFKILSACKNIDGNVLTLIPTNPKTQVTELKLLIDKISNLPIGGRVLDSSGNVTAIVFKNLVTNIRFTSEQFTAHFPRGIDVHDKRKEKNNGSLE